MMRCTNQCLLFL